MPALNSKLRSQLDDVCQKAREKAEEAARSALQKRAVNAPEPHAHFTPAEKELRNRLRARGRQAGDSRQTNKSQRIEQLTQELAYEYWHRMLFARLLAENHLLMHPDGVAVSLEECEELAKSERAPNGFVLAARYASKMLPQVFRTDDVLLDVEFAPEHRLALEKLLASLPRETFLADDSLGWVYQFWQSKRKDEVNRTGDKIDSRTLSAVTQLFTEDYMVQFLLHNTIGAWWCVRHGIRGPAGGAGIPAGKAPVEIPYLRWRDDGTPAAGTFDGWPKTLQEFKMIDPCCGSGHFLVAAFNLLVPLRMHDDGLTASEACDAVLRENLFGLELDPRCTQIAAFALAVAAWKYPDLPSPASRTRDDGRGAGGEGQPLGYRELPSLNIACTGIGPQATEDEWLKLAEQSGKKMSVLSREPILDGLRNLHALFSNAATLGSLINPNQLSADLITADYETLQPYLAAALTAEQADDDARERAVAAAGMVKAAELLAGEYSLVATNVPYLKREKQIEIAADYCEKWHSDAKSDLATCFVDRITHFVGDEGVIALVTPHNWLYARSYTAYRKRTLKELCWQCVARLGHGAFETISGEVVKPVLVVLGLTHKANQVFWGLDVSDTRTALLKAQALAHGTFSGHRQDDQLRNPDSVVSLVPIAAGSHLNDYADTAEGLSTGDGDRFIFCFWELLERSPNWEPLHAGPGDNPHDFGLQQVVRWECGNGELASSPQARIQGQLGWGAKGVLVSEMSELRRCLHFGFKHDKTTGVVVPKKECHLPAIYAFCQSSEYVVAIRNIDKSLKVAPRSLAKVPFDLEYWQSASEELFPDGIPSPESNDPSQWVFHGRPEESTIPLQVAVARLLSYRWPAEVKENAEGGSRGLDWRMRLSVRTRELVKRCDELLKFADEDGIVCVPAVRSESPAAERLLQLLYGAFGQSWSDSLLHDLLTDAGCKPGTTLDDWLRNQFFDQHCKRFKNRPFIWQIWDGHREGFSCLVNCHKLSYKTLDNLTHSYLENWIKKQAGDARTGKTGADLRLAASQGLQAKLKLILAGEPPYDIFVRWKPLHEQAIGWNPDLNDGVRMNIRPFVEAGILRKNPNIKWTKDRGKEPERDKTDFPWFWNGKTFTGDRVNDVHLTNAKKQAARDRLSVGS